MEDDILYKEWGISDKLPGAFVRWMNEYVNNELNKNKVFPTIASDLGVKAAHLSRWIVGLGPVTARDIKSLVKNTGPWIYSLLEMQRPKIL